MSRDGYVEQTRPRADRGEQWSTKVSGQYKPFQREPNCPDASVRRADPGIGILTENNFVGILEDIQNT